MTYTQPWVSLALSLWSWYRLTRPHCCLSKPDSSCDDRSCRQMRHALVLSSKSKVDSGLPFPAASGD
ncbi:hypothetical protein T01_1476 [Trichinella spiralis]|uniref:Secreted protein n=1 Tax=Trichinella spiralis TaxID=6334 RepID=A0A0V1AQ02_TRISP|nr:hypothetical protein T01_1476 [Trichinella spiralis]